MSRQCLAGSLLQLWVGLSGCATVDTPKAPSDEQAAIERFPIGVLVTRCPPSGDAVVAKALMRRFFDNIGWSASLQVRQICAMGPDYFYVLMADEDPGTMSIDAVGWAQRINGEWSLDMAYPMASNARVGVLVAVDRNTAIRAISSVVADQDSATWRCDLVAVRTEQRTTCGSRETPIAVVCNGTLSGATFFDRSGARMCRTDGSLDMIAVDGAGMRTLDGSAALLLPSP